MAKTPVFIREFVPLSQIKQNELKWSTYAGARLSYHRYLVSREFGVDPDKIYSTFVRNFKKHTKDFPLAAVEVGQEKNKNDYEKQEQYVLFLWQYYVVDKPKKPSLPKEPKETKVKKPDVQESYNDEVDPDNPYAGDDEPSMLQEMSRVKPPKGGALVKRRGISKKEVYEKVRDANPDPGKRPDELEEFDLPEDIKAILGEEFLEEIFAEGYTTYGEFYSALGEWQKKQGRSAPPEDKAKIANFKRGEVADKRQEDPENRFRLKTTSVSKSSFFNTKQLQGGPEKPQLLLPPADGKKKKRKASLEENVAAIRKSVEKIFKVLNGQFELNKKQADQNKKNRQKDKRKKKEDTLESMRKGFMNQARKLAAPSFDLLDRLFKFIGTVLLGRVLYKLMEFLANKENQEKVEALGRFLEDWWPVLLSAFVLFATPLGALIRSVLAGVVKLSVFMVKKGIPGLLKFVRKNKLAAAALGIGALGLGAMALMGGDDDKQPAQTTTTSETQTNVAGEKFDPNNPTEMQTKALDLKSQMEGPQKLKGGGRVQRNKRTLPGGGKITQSTGKRVKGAGKDTQMIVAQPGEVVMSKAAVDKFGAPFLLNLNKLGGGTNKPDFSKFSDLQFAQGGGVVGAKDFDMERVMQTLRDCYITPDDLGPAGPDNPRIQNVANYLYGMEQLNTKGLDEFQVMDLQDAKKSYPKIDRNRRRKNPLGANPEKKKEAEKKKAKAKPRPMGRSAAKKRMQAKKEENKGEEMKGPDDKNKVGSGAGAPFTGAVPSPATTKPPSPSAKPAPAMIGKGNLPPAPAAPQPKVNVVGGRIGGPPPQSKSTPGSSGNRDLPTDFPVFEQTETRMMMLAIYGITEVE